MKFVRKMVLVFVLFLVACQPATPPTVTVLDGHQLITLQTNENIPSSLFTQAGITLDENDRVLYRGFSVNPNDPITDNPINLQIRRAVTVNLITPDGQQQIRSSAFTVGEALYELSHPLHTDDEVAPSLNAPLEDGMTITIQPARSLSIEADGKVAQVQSSAKTVGEALAEAGIPLLGLDYSIPSGNEALPSDGQIKLVRVSESIILAQKPIPFESELVASTEVPLDQTQVLSPGEEGLSMQRIRIRYEDGKEVSRVTEDETLVRPPKTQQLAYGTKVEIKTAVVNGVEIEYWRAVQMYATSYSPCNLGTSTCGSTTASGQQLKKGMVALRTDLYFSLRGQPLFIPGYGFATVEDACGGCVGRPWIDLGFSDADYEAWHSWVTVYFLTPVPQIINYVFE